MQGDFVAFGAFGSCLLSKKMQFSFRHPLEFIGVFRKIQRKFIGAVKKIFRELLRKFGFFSIDIGHLLLARFIQLSAGENKAF